MDFINHILNSIFDLFFYPFRSINPVYGLCAAALLTAIIALPIFRYTSNQKGIRKTRDRITGHLLEMRLFKDDFRIFFSAQKNILKLSLIHLRYMLKPLMFMTVPVVIIIIQTGLRYEYRPIRPGEPAVVKVTINKDDAFSGEAVKIFLDAPDGLNIETPPLRVDGGKGIYWRIRTEKEGVYDLSFSAPDVRVRKSIIVADKFSRLSPTARKGGFFTSLLNPGDSILPDDSVVESFEVRYPPLEVSILGFNMHWLITFIILCLFFSLVLMKQFNVKI